MMPCLLVLVAQRESGRVQRFQVSGHLAMLTSDWLELTISSMSNCRQRILVAHDGFDGLSHFQGLPNAQTVERRYVRRNIQDPEIGISLVGAVGTA